MALGRKQLAVIEGYQRADSAFVYLDSSAQLALPQALGALATNAGFAPVDTSELAGSGDPATVSPSPCGDFIYPLWNKNLNPGSQDCIPDAKAGLTGSLSTSLDGFLENYLEENFPTSNYILTLSTEDRFPKIQPSNLVGPPAPIHMLVVHGTSLDPMEFILRGIADDGTVPSSISGSGSLSTPLPENFKNLPPDACSSSVRHCQLNSDAADQFAKTYDALKNAPPDKRYLIVVKDATRTIQDQLVTFNKYFPICGSSCVARPSPTAPHVTGGAIDMTLKKYNPATGAFDDMNTGPIGAPYAYNRYTFTTDQLAAQHEIEQVMCGQGWVRYSNEWWHFEYGTSRWTKGQQQGVCNLQSS